MRKQIYITFIILPFFVRCNKQPGKQKAIFTRDFQAAEYFDYYGIHDSAFYYYNRVIHNSGDSLEKGTAYFKMGLRLLEAGDFYSAQENLLSSIKTLNEKNSAHHGNISADYNTLGNATLELKDYETAIKYYNLASLFASDGDPQLYILNNTGVAYQKKGNYQKALAAFDSAIKINTNDTSIRAKIISNFARTKWLDDPAFNAVPDLLLALTLRQLIKDSTGINSSYSHLSDYYQTSQPESSFYYASKRLDIAQKLRDPNDKLDALSQLAIVSPPGPSKQYLKQYVALNDSLGNVRSRDRNQYALIKFDAEKSKADNLILQKHISQQRVTIWGTVFIAVVFIVVLVLLARARRRRLNRDSENALRQVKLKTSQKVHDVVANGLYKIMNELEHRETINKEPLLNQIEGLYEKSRDISYEEELHDGEAYDLQIHRLLTSFANDQTKVIIIGNDDTFWSMVTETQKQELQLVFDELLINMQKHSNAKNVVFQFKVKKHTGFVNYKDDGKGFPCGFRFGNGLKNTVNRIKSINGKIIFDKSSEDGVSILMSFPWIKSKND